MKHTILRRLVQRFLTLRFIRRRGANLDHVDPVADARNSAWHDGRWQTILNKREGLPKHGKTS